MAQANRPGTVQHGEPDLPVGGFSTKEVRDGSHMNNLKHCDQGSKINIIHDEDAYS
jgi:hypothetical protein